MPIEKYDICGSNIDSYVTTYEATLFSLNRTKQDLLDIVSRTSKQLQDKKELFSAEGLFWRILKYIPHAFYCSKLEAEISKAESRLAQVPSRQKNALKELVLNAARNAMTTSEAAGELHTLEVKHKSLLQLRDSVKSIKAYGDRTLQSIQNAIDKIDSAQGMETLDMFTDNKTLSLLSSIENSSASDAVSDARRSINSFLAHIKEHQNRVTQPEFSITIEMIDLAFDFSFGGMYDMIGSVMSSIALDHAEQRLREAYEDVQDIVSPIAANLAELQNQVKSHEEELLSFKKIQRERVIPLLTQKGIAVRGEFVQSISDLYAPSAARR